MRSLFTAACLCAAVAACGGRETVAPSEVTTAPAVASGNENDTGRLAPTVDRKTYLDVNLYTDANNDTVISFGDTIEVGFGIAPSVHDDVNAWVRCTQNGALIYQGSYNRYAWPARPVFQLGPTDMWPSGGAECRATLETVARQPKTLAVQAFTVAP